MKNFYYTKSYEMMQELGSLDELRKDLTLISMSPKQELQFKWHGILTKIAFSFKLNGQNMNPKTISRVLSPEGKKTISPDEQLVLNFKKALDYIFFNWNVSSQPVTVNTIKELFSLIFEENIPIDDKEIHTAIKYIQVSSEHPVIQASLAHIIFFDLFPTLTKYKLFSNVIFLLFLYKYGYNFRGFSFIEKDFVEGKINYKELMYESIKQENITQCLEYIIRTLVVNITSVINNVKETLPRLTDDVLFELTDRQKGILGILDNPDVKLTNKKVQELFNVSQITASRDLSYLASLGLLFSLGKGRSTYYTKV